MDSYQLVFVTFLVIWFSIVSSDPNSFKDLSLSFKVRYKAWPNGGAISDKSLEIWKAFINLLALIGEGYAVFQFAMSIAFPLLYQTPLVFQVHVMAPLLASALVRFMFWKQQKPSFEQIQILATILNGVAIINRMDVHLPKQLLAVNFMVRTFIGAFSSCPLRLVTMNLLSAPLAFAVEWASSKRNFNRPELVHEIDLVHEIANETLCIFLMSLIILHLNAVFQKQEMATQKLQDEIRVKEKIVKETESLLGAARRLLSVTCDCLVQLSHDWKLKEPDRSVKDMLKLGSKGSALHFSQFISPEDHDRFATFIRASKDSGTAPSSLHLKMQDTKGSSFHVQLFHVEIPNLLTDLADVPKEHLLGLIRQDLKEPPDAVSVTSIGCCRIPEGQELDCSSCSSSSRASKAKEGRRKRGPSEPSQVPEGWPKLDTVKLVLDLNTTEHGYAIRSIQVDLLQNCAELSLLRFVKRKYRAMVEDWIQEHMNCWMMQTPCDEPCLGCKLQIEGLGGVLVREMRVLRIDQEHHHLASEVPAGDRKLGYTLLMTVELKNFLPVST